LVTSASAFTKWLAGIVAKCRMLIAVPTALSPASS